MPCETTKNKFNLRYFGVNFAGIVNEIAGPTNIKVKVRPALVGLCPSKENRKTRIFGRAKSRDELTALLQLLKAFRYFRNIALCRSARPDKLAVGFFKGNNREACGIGHSVHRT